MGGGGGGLRFFFFKGPFSSAPAKASVEGLRVEVLGLGFIRRMFVGVSPSFKISVPSHVGSCGLWFKSLGEI